MSDTSAPGNFQDALSSYISCSLLLFTIKSVFFFVNNLTFKIKKNVPTGMMKEKGSTNGFFMIS